MTNTTPKFDFNGHQLRSVLIDGEPWFVAADACRCLGWEVGATHGGTTKHLRGLDGDEKRTVRRAEEPFVPLFQKTTASAVTLISRPGLFKLIQRSNKPEAKEFDRWVRHEVLPQVMDHGGYMLPGADPNHVAEVSHSNTSPVLVGMIQRYQRLLADSNQLNAELLTHLDGANAKLAEAAPKVEFVDSFVAAKGNLTLEQAAKSLKFSWVNKFTSLLRELGILRKLIKGQPAQARKEYIEKGWFEHHAHLVRNTNHVTIRCRVTPLGMTEIGRIVEALRKEGKLD